MLDCTADVVRERILRNSGGDRAERMDDTDREVAKKLLLYRERTEPLIDYYRQQGKLVTVGAEGEVDEVYRRLVESIKTA